MENNFTDKQFEYMVQDLRLNSEAYSNAKRIEDLQRAQTNVLHMVDNLASRGVVSLQQPDGSWRTLNNFEIQNVIRDVEGDRYITIRKSPADDPYLISMNNSGQIRAFSRGPLNSEQFMKQTTGREEPRKPGIFASIGNWFHKRFNHGEPSATFKRYYEQRDRYQILRYYALTRAGFRIGKPEAVAAYEARQEAERQQLEQQQIEREIEQKTQELDQRTVEPVQQDLVDQLDLKMFQGVLRDRLFTAGSGMRNQSNVLAKSNAFTAALRSALAEDTPEAAKLKGIVEGWVNGGEQESLRNAFDAFDMNHPENLTNTILNPPKAELPEVTKRVKEQPVNAPQADQPQAEMNGPVLERAQNEADPNGRQGEQGEKPEEKPEEINNNIENPVPPQVNTPVQTPVQTPISIPDQPGQQEAEPLFYEQPEEQPEEPQPEPQPQQPQQPQPEPVLQMEARTFRPEEEERLRKERITVQAPGNEENVVEDPAEQAKAAAFYEVLNNATAGDSAEARELKAFLDEEPDMLQNMYETFDVSRKDKLVTALAEQAKVLVEESKMVNEDNAPLADAADMSKANEAPVNEADAPGAKAPEPEIINKEVPDEAQAPLAYENGKEKTAEAIGERLDNQMDAYIEEKVATMNPKDAAKEIRRKEAFVNTWKAAMTGNTGKALFIKNFVEKRMDENPAMFEMIYDGFDEGKVNDMKSLFDVFYKDEMVSEKVNEAMEDPEITALAEKIADRLVKDNKVKDLNDEKKEAFIDTLKYAMAGKTPVADGVKNLFTEYLKTEPGTARDRYLSDLYNHFDEAKPHLTAARVQDVFDPKVSAQEIGKTTIEYMPTPMIIKMVKIREKAWQRIAQQNDLAAAKAVEDPSKKMDPLTMGPK